MPSRDYKDRGDELARPQAHLSGDSSGRQHRAVAEAAVGDLVVADFTTGSRRSACHADDRSVLQRLGPLGSVPVNRGPPSSASSRGGPASLIAEVKPTWSSLRPAP